MDCLDVRDQLISGAYTPALERHLASCEACAELAAGDGALASALGGAATESDPAPLGALFQAVGQTVQRDAGVGGRLRSLSTRARWVIAAASLGTLLAVGVATRRPDLDLYPRGRFALELATLCLMALATFWLWLRPLQRPAAPAWLRPLLLGLAAALPWALASLPAAHAPHAATLAAGGAQLIPRALACLSWGIALSLPVAAIGLLLGRGDRTRMPAPLLAVAAATVGGLAALHLHCPVTQSAHLLIGHAPIVVALMALFAGVTLAVVALGRRGPTRS